MSLIGKTIALVSRTPRRAEASTSAVINVSAFDAPYLAVTVPHILRQARYAFSERILVVDPRMMRGRRSAPGQPGDVMRIATAVLAAGHVDRIVELDTSEACRRRVIERTYEREFAPTADTVGASYAPLFAIEAAQHDLVAWFGAALVFYTTDDSWVDAGLAAIAHDTAIWLAATRSGRPQFNPRQMLGALVGDGMRRDREGAARHFVVDRRRLRHKLRHVAADREQLGTSMTATLEAHGASIAIIDHSWHLHPRSTQAPYPQWIERIARAAERGELPAVQRDGCLRLDDATQRIAWRQHLFPAVRPQSHVGPRAAARVVERRVVPGSAPLSIIIPLRDRAGSAVRNSLASLRWQTSGRPWEVILVSHGSKPEIDVELREVAREAGATLINVGTPDEPWNKPLALNTGILATDPGIAFVMTMDGDMILAETMLASVLATLRADPKQIVLCQSSDLPEGLALPTDATSLHAALPTFLRHATRRPTYGTGGIQALSRSFLFDVRGYDEDMLWWGALDTDMLRRAEASGLRATWITEQTYMLHQFHLRKYGVLDGADRKGEARDAWLRNHELMLERERDVVRNRDSWGAAIER